MIRSMTGFASATGAHESFRWSWELRGVNAKGLDMRLRVPDWVEGLEIGLRKGLGGLVKRGNITLSLRLSREEGGATTALNAQALQTLLDAMAQIETQAMDAGLSLAPSTSADIVAMRGVMEAAAPEQDTPALATALLAQSQSLIASFDEMRQKEGAALGAVLAGQLSEIEALTKAAAAQAHVRADTIAQTFRDNVAKIMDTTEIADEARIAQELALLAVKADVTEEIDRLYAHVSAARDLLDTGGAVGRKLDFLMQEFNREANTLCSKAQNTDLTRIGLALKVLIDQMREQVQNVE